MPRKTAPSGNNSPLVPVVLLFLVGSMIALSVNLSKLVADAGAPVLWLVSLSLLGAGAVILVLAAVLGQLSTPMKKVLPYTVGAGAFLAIPTVLSFLAVAHVGPGFMSLVYAFPVLFTYLLAVSLKMEHLQTRKALGVASGLLGGILLASLKLQTLGVGGWLAIAACIPLIIGFGNIYRTRFWPESASAIFLSAITLIMAGAMIGVLATLTEGVNIQHLWQRPYLSLLLLANLAVFAIQFVFYFILQRLAGPTYLSQIGSVGAALGVGISVLVFQEPLPGNFWLAILLIALGVVLFQRRIAGVAAP
ncbi:MAG: DMT family transporter [Paracoccaceae bacterium]